MIQRRLHAVFTMMKYYDAHISGTTQQVKEKQAGTCHQRAAHIRFWPGSGFRFGCGSALALALVLIYVQLAAFFIILSYFCSFLCVSMYFSMCYHGFV